MVDTIFVVAVLGVVAFCVEEIAYGLSECNMFVYVYGGRFDCSIEVFRAHNELTDDAMKLLRF